MLFRSQQGVNWSTEGGSVDNNQTVRNLYYQLQLNWARKFGHNPAMKFLVEYCGNKKAEKQDTRKVDQQVCNTCF